MKNHNRCVVLYAKSPVAGKVKTRLCKRYGAIGAKNIYRKLLSHKVQQLSDLNDVCDLFVSTAPIRFHACWYSILPVNFSLEVQAPGDLGRRMAHTFRQKLKQYDSVIIVGADCIGVTAEIIARSFQQLESHNAVLVPAEDGGYTLIGLRRFCASVFNNMPWGSARVCKETVSRFKRSHMQCAMLPAVPDIDTPHDWKKYKELLDTLRP